MSFYGNSFTYTAESFARIVLANLGLNRSEVETFPEDKFDLIGANQTATIDAESRKTGVHISSGNQWIQLGISSEIIDPKNGKKKNEFCIMHGPPARQANQPFIIPLYLPEVSEVDEKVLNQEGAEPPPVLGFDKYLAFPVIKYDNAGHIVFDQDNAERAYFKMPPDPNLEFEETLDEELKKVYNTIYVIDSSSAPAGTPNGKIQDLESELYDLTDPSNGTLALLEDKVDEAVKDLSDVTDNVDAALKDFEENKLKPIEEDIEEIQEAKNKLEMIDGISSMATGVSSQVVALANWIKEHLDEAESYSVNQLLGIEPI